MTLGEMTCLKKIQKLELAQQSAEANTKKIAAENEAFNKEVERLKHIVQLRAVPVPLPAPSFSMDHRYQQRPAGGCFNCGQFGHLPENVRNLERKPTPVCSLTVISQGIFIVQMT